MLAQKTYQKIQVVNKKSICNSKVGFQNCPRALNRTLWLVNSLANRKTSSESRVFGCYFTRVRRAEPPKKFTSGFDKDKWQRSSFCSSTKKFTWLLLIESKPKRGTGSCRGHWVTSFDLLGSKFDLILMSPI